MQHIDKRTKILLTLLFPILLVSWNLGFDLGAFGTIFYRNVMTAWVFAVATFISLIYLKITKKTEVKTAGIIVLLIPMCWPLVDYFDQHISNTYIHYFIIFDYLLIVLTLGFAGYIFLKIVKYDIFDPLTIYHKLTIFFTAIVFSALGFLVGHHHYWFFECGHFDISGEFVPTNCYAPQNSDYRTLYKHSWEYQATPQQEHLFP